MRRIHRVLISGYGVTNLKTLRDSLSRKFMDLAKKSKKGDVKNVEYLLKKKWSSYGIC